MPDTYNQISHNLNAHDRSPITSLIFSDDSFLSVDALTIEKLSSLNKCMRSTFHYAKCYYNHQEIRLFIIHDSSGEPIDYLCYTETYNQIGLELNVLGPTDLSIEYIYALIARRSAYKAIVSQLIGDNLLAQQTKLPLSSIAHAYEDMVIKLPDHVDDYIASLGHTTQKHLRYYIRRLANEYGESLQKSYIFQQDITLDTLKKIVNFNRERLENKGQKSLWSEVSINNRYQVATELGFIFCLEVNGEIIGGTMNYIYGNDAYLFLIGHNPSVDKYNTGNICLYFTIEKLIDLGISNYHLFGGEHVFYKKQFNAECTELLKAEIYTKQYYIYLDRTLHFIEEAGEVIHRYKHLFNPIVLLTKVYKRIITRFYTANNQ